MYVSITSCTAGTPGVCRVRHVEVDQTAAAGEVASHSDGLIATNRTDGNGIVHLLVDLQGVISKCRHVSTKCHSEDPPQCYACGLLEAHPSDQ